MFQNYENTVKTVKAACVLHNYILLNCNNEGQYLNSNNLQQEDKEGGVTPGSWQQEGPASSLQRIGQVAGNRSGTKTAKDQRDFLAQKLVTDGLAPWQFKYTFRTS